MNAGINFHAIVAVFLGGGLGCVLRYLIGVFLGRAVSVFPLHTFLANIIGCFILGVVFAVFMARVDISSELKLFMSVGFCGGLTTFSTFSWELITLFPQNWFLTILYGSLSLFLGLVSVLLGLYFGGVLGKNV